MIIVLIMAVKGDYDAHHHKFMRKYILSVLMKTDVKLQIVKHTIIYPAVTEFFFEKCTHSCCILT